MKKIILSCCIAALTSWTQADAQVTKSDYMRSDSILNLERKVYCSGVVAPGWLEDSQFFYYKNKEKDGTFYYLVNAKTGKMDIKRFLKMHKYPKEFENTA